MGNVLIVEDEEILARVISLCLRACGHDTHMVRSLRPAFAELESGWPQVVTLDLKLGEEDGAEVVDFARQKDSRAKFLIISGFEARDASIRLCI